METDFEDKFVLKYGALEQDFEELQADTQEVVNQLQKVKEAKLILRAEVRFLQSRAKMLKESASSSEGKFHLKEPVGEASQVLTSSWVPGGRAACKEVLVAASKPPLFQSSKQGITAERPSKTRDVVSKTSNLKQGANGFPPTKKAGKRKISWLDEYSVKA